MIRQDNFRIIEPYVPGDQPDLPDMVKLNTNENPYPPSPAVAAAASAFDTGRLKLYPPADSGALKKDIAKYHGVDPDMVFVGVGSDDVLSVIFQSCFCSGRSILFPEISYSFYEVWADMYRVPFTKIPLAPDMSVDARDYLGRPGENGGVIICNPNAPTGIVMPAEDVERIAAGNPSSPVVVDEAYADFSDESVMGLAGRYDNLIVVRTFSKSRSMAGLRIGYAVAAPDIIGIMNNVKNSVNSYTLNFPAIELGRASLSDDAYFKTTIARIRTTRERLTAKLAALGFKTLPSGANFVFTTHPDIPAKLIYEELKAAHVFVRYFNRPGIDNYLRITVGTEEEVDRLTAALKEITQKAISAK